MGGTLTFLGAAGTVTGSKYLLESGGKKVLIDAGLFQGDRAWRERNWDRFPIDLPSINSVLITHAHIDHIGILPRLVRNGLNCPVYATRSTIDLSRMLLLDSANLQEEEAEYREQKGTSRHQPPEPLYNVKDAERALTLFRNIPFGKVQEILPGIKAEWYRAGHILGAASIRVECSDRVITFSGDIGRYGVPVLRDPEPHSLGNLLLIESTYGDKLHGAGDNGVELARIINETYKRNGVVVIPSFAVGRCQHLLYLIRELKEKRMIPDLPVIIDSPMADDATELYSKAVEEYDDEALGIVKRHTHPFTFSKLYFIKDRSESIRLNTIVEPMIIISASGMLSGGRILHHLKHRISQPANTILFVGHQPHGGRGAWILSGAKTFRLFGREIPIRAQIEEISAFSAHGDKADLLHWCRDARAQGSNPDRVAIVHGEPETAQAFSTTLKSEMGWSTFVAEYQQKIEI